MLCQHQPNSYKEIQSWYPLKHNEAPEIIFGLPNTSSTSLLKIARISCIQASKHKILIEGGIFLDIFNFFQLDNNSK